MPIDKRELLALLRDPQVLNFLRSQVVQNASSMTIGRFPGQGSAENDNWPYRDACDAAHPFNVDYVVPKNFQRIISAKLSVIIRPYRTYSTLTLSSTGNASNDHTHGMGHNHSHAHNYVLENNASFINVGFTANNRIGLSGGGTDATGITTDATGSSAGSTGGQSATHTHTVSGTTTLGIAEDSTPVNPGITIAFDGVDRTAALGGPFNATMIEVDVTQFLPTSTGVQHTVALQPNQRATITAMLKISYAVDSRLAQ